MEQVVRTGVATIITRLKKKEKVEVLLGLRGDGCEAVPGTWAWPGGRMDPWETPLEAAKRELGEETGLETTDDNAINFMTYSNEPFPEIDKHYVCLVFIVGKVKGEPVIKEKDKCKEWRWFDLDELPENMFPPAKKVAEENYGLILGTARFYHRLPIVYR